MHAVKVNLHDANASTSGIVEAGADVRASSSDSGRRRLAFESQTSPVTQIAARIVRMDRHARVVTWNGKDMPPELRDLPAGRYVVEPVEDEAPLLSVDEEAGIEAALESYRQGRLVDAKRAREILDAALGR